jgi:predicted secreted protein
MKTTQKLILAAGLAATLLLPSALLQATQEFKENCVRMYPTGDIPNEPAITKEDLFTQLTQALNLQPIAKIQEIVAAILKSLEQKNTFDDNVIKGDNRTIRIAAGETFTLKLRENFTTGYHFGTPLTGDSVQLVSSEHIQDPAPADYCGVGGTRIFTFKALKKGSYVVAIPQVTPSRENPVHAYPFMVVIE